MGPPIRGMGVVAVDAVGDFSGLVRAAARADREAVARLFSAYWPLLRDRYRAWGWGDMAEDLAMDVWVALLAGGLARFQGGERQFRAWLETIARRRLADRQRSWGRQRRLVVQVGSLDLPRPSSASRDPAELVDEHAATERAVAHLFAHLPEAQAEAVALRVIVGLSLADAARIMERSPKAVSMLHRRGMATLAGLPSVAPG